MREPITGLFEPRSVAVIGASRTEGKVGHEILRSLVKGGFEGPIYPVNPKAAEVLGLRCYPDLAAIGAKPDLAIIAVPARAVPEAMRQCVSAGVRFAVVISAGFREVGEEGRRLEEQVVEIARRGKVRMLGPNCLGLMVPARKLNASFGGDLPPAGVIGYMSQSGSLLAAMLDMAHAAGIGFSKLVSMGNKADIDEIDLLRALGEDDETKVIAGYLETITDGDEFLREAERVSRLKPVLLMKSGITGAGARAAETHTGTFGRSEMAYEVVFERVGVIRCASTKQQMDFAKAFACQPLPAGTRVAVIANGGGPAIMAADACESEGLQLAPLTPQTLERIRAALPDHAVVSNPVDVLGDATVERYKTALEAVVQDPSVDAVLVLLTPHGVTDVDGVAAAVGELASQSPGKPILACLLGGPKVAAGIRTLTEHSVPCYDSPEAAVAALKAMADYARWRSRPPRVVKLFPVNRRKVEHIVRRHLDRRTYEIGEMEAKEILEAYGFAVPRSAVATSAEQAVSVARQIGYPVVLKIWSPDIIHKHQVGGVRINLGSDQEVMDAFDLMMYRVPKKVPDADILGVLVEEMVRGQEVILGMQRDPRFGPLMMFGLGGIMVEVLKEVAFYPAPLTAEEAKEMLQATRTYQLLTSGAGSEGVDVDAIAEALQRLSQLATEFPQIQHVEIDPYVVGPPGFRPIVVDAHMRLTGRAGKGGRR